MNWASNHDASIEKLQRVQGGLTVDLIMVPRDEFMTCRLDETVGAVVIKNTEKFSYLPVADPNKQIIGLYNAERWFEGNPPEAVVADDYHPLSEQIVIGADASIFDFIRQADAYPTNLVVSRERIAGLVSLSDIQQLPVRAALFSLITSLEMAMGSAIAHRWPDENDWIALLSEGRLEKMSEEIKAAKRNDTFIDAVSFTQFSDKADLIRKSGNLSGSRRSIDTQLKEIRKLRDNLAHANRYADTPAAAKSVCGVVRSIYAIKRELLENISKCR